MGKFAKITGDWLMRGWEDPAFAVVNRKTGEIRPFTDRVAFVARSCNGRTDFNSPFFQPVHHEILDTFIRHGIARECRKGDAIDTVQQFSNAENPYVACVHWSITGRCNMNCRHCYMEAPGQRYRDLDTQGIDHVLAQFSRANVMQVSISGGEPFFRKDLFSILEKLTAMGIRVRQFYTNGLLVTEQMLDRLKSMGMAPKFSISFDGCGCHDRMRGMNGVEQKTIDAVEMIVAAGFSVNVATSIDNRSMDCLAETYGMMTSLNVDSWTVAPPTRTGNWAGSRTSLTPGQEITVYNPILKKWGLDGKPFDLQLGRFYNSKIEPGGDGPPRSGLPFAPDGFECEACRSHLCLLPNGTVLPCPAFAGTEMARRMPNINDQSLSKILGDSVLSAFANEKKRKRLACNPECRDCDLFRHCGMGCRAMAYIETGDIYARDLSTCKLIKAREYMRNAV